MTASPPRARIGIDMGGTKIAGVLLDEAGHARAAERIAMPQGDYGQSLDAVAGLVSRLAAEAAAEVDVGIGLPGRIDAETGCVAHCNATWLNGQPFRRDLEEATGLPLRFANDGECFALSEARDGAGAGRRLVLGVVLGTGCGGGIVFDGRIFRGAGGLGAELGHIPLPPGSPQAPCEVPCFCGARNCLEQHVSGTALSRRWRETTGEDAGAAQIGALAEAGDAHAARLLGELEDALARALAIFATLVGPDAIVLGGGLSNIARLRRNLPPLMRAHAPAIAQAIPVLPARWGDASGARGAAWLCEDNNEYRPCMPDRQGEKRHHVQQLAAEGF